MWCDGNKMASVCFLYFAALTLVMMVEATNISASIWTPEQATSLNALFGKLGQDVGNLKSKQEIFEKVQDEMNADTKKLQKIVSFLMSESKLDKETETVVNRTLARLIVENDALKRRIDNLERIQNSTYRNISLRPEQNKLCSFSVSMVTDGKVFIEHQTVIFDHVTTNVGECYSAHDGVFTSSTVGAYFFTVSTDSTVSVELVKNGRVIDVGFVSNSRLYSAMITLELNTGDQMWLRTKDGGSSTSNGIASFSGFLIRAL